MKLKLMFSLSSLQAWVVVLVVGLVDGGWGMDFTRLMLISTQLEVVVRGGRNYSLYNKQIMSL